MSNIFNLSRNLEKPRIYLCKKDFSRIGEITAFTADVTVSVSFENPNELSFTVYKTADTLENPYWDDLVNLKLIYVSDYDEYFEIEVSEQECETARKQVTAQSLCESELSNLNISLEVNTDTDIDRTDYSPTILYNPDNPSASLLHRILKDKAPHYTISHVDSSLASLQRTFSVDSNIDDFLRRELSQEIDAHVEYNTSKRSISLYDMLSVCNECGFRGNYYDSCPMCGSTNVKNGYGEWTNVYISADNLADEISLTAEKSVIKNCFKVIGGDDSITNRIPSVNPNGTGYIVRFSDLQYNDMPAELADKLKSYEVLCKSKKEEYRNVTLTICECLDKILYYQSAMMPSPSASETDSSRETVNITSGLSALMSNAQAPNTIGLNTFSKFTTVSLVNSAILSYVKILLSPDYEVSIKSSSYSYEGSYGVWKGVLHVNSISYPDTDQADSGEITLKVDGNAVAYVTQKTDKVLAAKNLKDQAYDYSLYSVDALQNFIDAYEACEGILIDHGDSGMAAGTPQYAIYNKYRTLKEAVIAEQAKKREIIAEWTRKKENCETQQKAINGLLNLQNYLGVALFKLYCAYRRDDTYQNSNYISDGLSDAELLKQAEQLLDCADQELAIACRNQYSLSATMNNLFLMDEFAPFHDKCRLGNWIYADINDSVFLLRLVKIGINYESTDKVTVEFSNTKELYNTSGSIKTILNGAQSIAASYPATIKQVSEDSKTVSQVNNWVNNGLNATDILIANSPMQNTVFDKNGIWCRGYDEINGDFEPTQLRIVNSTLAVTDDNWETTKAAIGKYMMQDPVTGEYKYAMGVIGETIVGKLLLGEKLGIYNNHQSMIFDKNGLMITNGKNIFTVNPNATELLTISNEKQKIFYVDTNGVLHIQGDGSGLDISTNKSIGMKVNTSDFSAQKIVSMINMEETGVQIAGEKVDITGQVTFNSFTADLKNDINTIDANASNAKLKTDGLANGATVINGGCISTGSINADLITTGTIDADKVNVINVKAASVDAENITGTRISGKEITGSTIESTELNGCSGSFTSIFLHNKDLVDTFQYGSICGQYLSNNGKVRQCEVIRINNMSNASDMYVFRPMYFQNDSAELILHSRAGMRFGSILNTDHSRLPAYINTLDTSSSSGRAGIRMGFIAADAEKPGFEIYDDYNLNSSSHTVSAKVFGNLEVSGVVADQSSIKYKTNVHALSDSEALKLLEYDIVSFDYKDGRRGRHGMIAEEAAKISDYAIVRDRDNQPDAISYASFVPDLIKLNQIMYKEIQDLKQQIKELKGC